MKRRYTSRPAPGMSAVGAVVGIIMLMFGIGVMSKTQQFHPFFILWIGVGVFIVGYHLINAISGRGPATTIIESEEEDETSAEARPVAERLRELEELRQQQLVSEVEYEEKRKEILKDV